jgi:hypothetical protein
VSVGFSTDSRKNHVLPSSADTYFNTTTNSFFGTKPPQAGDNSRVAEPFARDAGSSSASSSAEDGGMQFDDSKSGDHLETAPDKPPVVVSNIPERQGVTGHNVRYMLFFGIAAIVIAFAVMLVIYLV